MHNAKEEYKGLDLAVWNELEDINLVKLEGIDFVILKVINKSNRADGRYHSHLAACRAVGINVIAGYTYSYANTVEKAKKAADAFIAVAGGDIDVMVLDLEDVTMTGLGHRIVDIIRTYQRMATDAGMGFIIYTGASYYNPCLKPYAQEIADIDIWWARYPSNAIRNLQNPVPDKKYLPNIPNNIIGWQYSSKGFVPGIKGYVDLNVWYKEIESNGQQVIAVPQETNPYPEPTTLVRLGSKGEGAKWVQWYLWRFGLLLTNGVPDSSRITGCIDEFDVTAIKDSQQRLGLTGKNVDGIVGLVTRALYKKTC